MPFGESALARNINASWVRSNRLMFTGDFGHTMYTGCLDKTAQTVLH
jgi:hypothetical protein